LHRSLHRPFDSSTAGFGVAPRRLAPKRQWPPGGCDTKECHRVVLLYY
jgi:hypothetical protein